MAKVSIEFGSVSQAQLVRDLVQDEVESLLGNLREGGLIRKDGQLSKTKRKLLPEVKKNIIDYKHFKAVLSKLNRVLPRDKKVDESIEE